MIRPARPTLAEVPLADLSFLYVQDWNVAGRTAYFTDGSLQLVVVPEPSTFAMLGSVMAVGFFLARRRSLR